MSGLEFFTSPPTLTLRQLKPEKISSKELHKKFSVWERQHSPTMQAVIKKVRKLVDFVEFGTFHENLLSNFATCYKTVRNSLASKVMGLVGFSENPNIKIKTKKEIQNILAGYLNINDRFVFLVQHGKSNQWTADLICRKMKKRSKIPFFPKYLTLGNKDARQFTALLEPQKSRKKRRQHLKDKIICITDDGSFSGKQLSDHLRGLLLAVKKFDLSPYKICVICPYMTDHAHHNLWTTYRKFSVRLDIELIIAKPQKINTLNGLNTTEKDLLRNTWFKSNPATAERVGLTCFAHKTPNAQSFPEAIASGKIISDNGDVESIQPIIDNTIPPYKHDYGDKKIRRS